MHSKQGFRFETKYCIKLLNAIKNNINNKDALKDITGAGENRIIAFLDWLKYINAIEIKNQEITLTYLGKAYLLLEESDDLLEPLMLYHLLRNPDLENNDGHYYFSEVVTEVLYNKFLDYENNLNSEYIKNELFKKGADKKYPQFITSVINTLSDSSSGFGKMGLLEKLEDKDQYEIHSYWVEPLIGAYILYDIWDDHKTSMGINNIVNDKYNLGKMFLMDEEAIKETLGEIQALGLIDIEKGAGLNQIRIKDKYTKEDILDMIVREV